MSFYSLISGLGVGTVASAAGITVIKSTGKLWFEKIIFSGSNEILTKHRELPCIDKLFGSIKWVASKNSSNSQIKTKIEDGTIALGDNSIQGCISVWWQKRTYKENKWRGNWNLAWGIRDGKYGTIFTSTILADQETLKTDSVIYVLEKKGNKWTTIGNWKTITDVIVNENKTSRTIQKGDSLVGKTDDWDFIKSEEFDTVSKNICERKKCTQSPKVTVKGIDFVYIKGKKPKDNTEYTATQWSSNVNTWVGTGSITGIDLTKFYEKAKGYYKSRG